MKKIAAIPTLCTLAGGVCGFMAIYVAARIPLDQPTPEQLRGLSTAGWLIFAAMAFDGLDGYLARLAKSTSEFGAQLDSLCDTISFGAAPAFVFSRLCIGQYEHRMLLVAVLFVVCVILRLARFNVETGNKLSDHLQFSGLPSPAAAGTIASFAILLYGAGSEENIPVFETGFEMILPFIGIGLALLMVSRIPYPHLINDVLHGHHRFQHIVKLVFAVAMLLFAPRLFLPILFSFFAASSLLRYGWEAVVLRRPREEPLF